MSIATAVILNVAAVVGLLVLLAATMRLPYHLPTTPRSGEASQRVRAAAGRRPRRAGPRGDEAARPSRSTSDSPSCDQAAARSDGDDCVDRHRREQDRQVEQ